MKRIHIGMWETIGGSMEFDLPDGISEKEFTSKIENELAEKGIEELEKYYDTKLSITHRETDIC